MKSSKIILRPVNLAQDIRAIYDLEHHCFDEEAFELEEFLYFYQIGADMFWVAYDDKQLAGYVMANIEDDAGYIPSIAIHPKYRRQGLAVHLMQKVMMLLKAKNIDFIRLHVRESNTAAIALYEKLGFTIEGSEENYYPDNEAAYRMVYSIHNVAKDS